MDLCFKVTNYKISNMLCKQIIGLKCMTGALTDFCRGKQAQLRFPSTVPLAAHLRLILSKIATDEDN